jgi:lysophospholipase L1-like esterase
MYSAQPFIWHLFDRSTAHPNQKGYAKMGEIVAAHLQTESE